MKPILFFFLLLVTAVGSSAQNLALQWLNPISSPSSEDSPFTSYVSGNVVTVGTFSGTVDFDPSATGNTSLTNIGSTDIFIQKLDALEGFIWAKQIGGTGSVNVRKMVTDNSGNIYITGTFNGTCDFDPDATTSDLTSVGGVDGFLLKLDQDGVFAWVKQVKNTNYSVGLSIGVDNSGNVFNTGIYSAGASTNIDPGATDYILPAPLGTTSMFIQKRDVNGNLVWAQGIGQVSGNSFSVNGNAVTADPNGNVYISGFFGGSVDFDASAASAVLNTNGANDIFILKLNGTGSLVWLKQIGGSSSESVAACLISSSGYLYLDGSFATDQLDFDPGAGVSQLSNVSSGPPVNKGFVEKLDTASGSFIWVKGIGGTTSSVAVNLYAIASDAYDNIYIDGSYSLTTANSSNQSLWAKFDGAGDQLLFQLFGTGTGPSNFSIGNSIAVTNSGDVYTAGVVNGTVDFDAATSYTSSGQDVYLVKWSQVFPCLTVLNTSDNGDNTNPVPGSLRAVVKCANTQTGHADITFAIPGAGPYVITTSGPPLVITNTKGVSVDAATQLSSGVGTGSDQSVTLKNGMFILSDAGPSSFSNMSFSTSPYGINAFSDSLTVSGCRFSQSAIRVNLTTSTDSNQVVIKNNSFDNAVFGIDIQGVNNLKIDTNTLTNVSGIGIRAQSCNQVSIRNNTITATASATDLAVMTCQVVTVANNQLDGGNIGMNLVSAQTGSAYGNSIKNISYGMQYSTTNFTINDNTIDNYAMYGIWPYAGGGLVSSDVLNNILTNGASATAAMAINISNGKVNGNIIDKCVYGIDVANNQGGAVTAEISNNTITNFTSCALDLGQSSDLTVYNNMIVNGTGYGINVPRSHTNLKIHKNFIGVTSSLVNAPISGCAIFLTNSNGGQNIVISNNTIGVINGTGGLAVSAGGGSGIYENFTNATDISITKNYIGIDSLNHSYSILNTGIYLNYLTLSHNLSVTKNSIGNCESGLITNDCEDILIKGNTFTSVNTAISIVASAAGQGIDNKISQNNFSIAQLGGRIVLNQGAVAGNNDKAVPVVNSYAAQADPSVIAINGTSAAGDTVEVFVSLGTVYKQITYAISAKADASGNWQAVIQKSLLYTPNTTQQDPSAVILANATDASGNTSPFNFTYPLPFSVCSNPVLNALPASQSFCSGDLLIIQGGSYQGINNYAWYNNATGLLLGSANQLGVTQPGDYRFEITDNFGCKASDTITVTVKALPTAAEFLMASEAGIGDEVLVIDISLMDKNSLVWDFGNAQSTQESYGYNLVFPDTGYHEVKVTTSQNGCSTSNSHFIHVGLESKAGTDGKVYPYEIKDANAIPNPNDGIFNLSVELTKSENIKVEVLNFMGMLLTTVNSAAPALSHTLPFDFSSYSSGTYLLRVRSDQDSRVIRVSKN